MHRATSNRRLNSSAVEYSPFDFRTTRSCFITRVSGWKRRTASVIDAANSFESRRVDKSGGGGEILFRTSIFRVSKKKTSLFERFERWIEHCWTLSTR